MTLLADAPARLRALMDLESTLLVEAAAGTGKTALIAGRLTMLLVSGIRPANIAAITFGELAASELSARVHRYVEDLLAGRIPVAMRPALPAGISGEQRVVLAAAARRLDELTTTTIHAFCQSIICSYAVEADVDPGARILDAPQADMAFESTFQKWLKGRLDGPFLPDDPIAALSREDPHRVVGTLRQLAKFRLEHRSARPPAADLTGRPDIDLADETAAFRRWVSAQPVEPKTIEVLGELERLTEFYLDAFLPPHDFSKLWRLAHPPRLSCMRKDTYDLLVPKRKSAWVRIAGKNTGERLSNEADRFFERINAAYRLVLGRIATALVERLSGVLDGVLDEYTAFKRAAAVLDFDDLLEKARLLVRDHDGVRRALGSRYRHIFVDEFQDTDPIQAEILFRIAADARTARWQDSMLRAGALFMVGDPKQAIYEFRGANVGSYGEARTAVQRQWPGNVIQITANFRSRPGIVDYINHCFEAPLSGPGQPGYVLLVATVEKPDQDQPCAVKITVDHAMDPRSGQIRDAEAAAIADVCARLVGNLMVRDENGNLVPLGPGGIALLAPAGTELWRYERALEERGLPIASQAGKGLFRRQEVQDLLAVARALADAGDTLAFGAVMRGPLVGLSEEELLDITGALPVDAASPGDVPRFSLSTDPADVSHPLARRTLSILRELRRRSRATTPALLLAESVERLDIRSVLAIREGDRSARAVANVDAFLERAKSYGTTGLVRFVRDMTEGWSGSESHEEGRVDAEGDAIEIVTIHSSKGLEWPVVIPINTVTQPRSRAPFVHRPPDNSLHWLLGDVVPPELDVALLANEQSMARERERLWYVACTRARDMLIVPELPQAAQSSWARIVDLAHGRLPEFDLPNLRGSAVRPRVDPPNEQTRPIFQSESDAIAIAAAPMTWRRPSDHDPDRMQSADVAATESGDAVELEIPVGAGRVRGLVLHKLMEEVLSGELTEDFAVLSQRAGQLVDEVAPKDAPVAPPEPDEIAATICRTLQIPQIVELRPHLIAELPVYGLIRSRPEPSALAGRVDAAAVVGGRIVAVLDWKSDIAPTEQDVRNHAGQIQDYLQVTGAGSGVLVYMTSGTVRRIALH
jgi:ATP-dependent exoDNAse (exonuclease V) beta subunit